MEPHLMIHLTKNECSYLIQSLDCLVRSKGLNHAGNCHVLATKLQNILNATEEKEDATHSDV